mgnify:CR=1 FL=1
MLELAVRPTDPPMGADQYLLIQTRAWWLSSVPTSSGLLHHLAEHVVRTWIPGRPERDWLRRHEVTGRRRWLTGSEEEARREGLTPDEAVTVTWSRGPGGDFRAEDERLEELTDELTAAATPRRRGSWHAPTSEFLAALPRDPSALLDRLVDGPSSRFTGPFSRAVDLLRSGAVPADLREALYAALVRLPAVTVDEAATDPEGRPCLALVHDAGPTRTELFVDADTGQFAGERDTLRKDSSIGLGVGTVIATTAVRTAVVDHVDDLV